MSNLKAQSFDAPDQKAVNALAANWSFDQAIQHAMDLRANKQPQSGPSVFFHNRALETINANKIDYAAMRGVHVPWNVLSSRAGAGGGNSLNYVTSVRSAFTTVLSDAAILPELGAVEINGLFGKVSIPRQISTTDATWADNSSESTAVDDALEESSITSSTLYIVRKVPRSLTLGPGVSDLLMREMGLNGGSQWLSSVLNGSGGTGVPRGLLQIAGDSGTDVQTVSLPTSGNPTFSSLIEIERKHAASRALSEKSSWIVSPTMLETLRGIADSNGHPVLTSALDGNRLLGYRIRSTPSCPANKLIFGDFSKIALLVWEPGLDLLVDQFSLVSQIKISIFMYLGHLILQPGAFVVAS